MTDNQLSVRRKSIALALSLPATAATVLMVVGRIAEAFGNTSLGMSPGVGLTMVLVLLLVPFSAAILLVWAIASWANHGRVPVSLLWTFTANALVFLYLYRLTHP